MCSLLFIAFALIYLLHVQRPLLAYVLQAYAGSPEYHPFIATAVIMVIILLPPFFLYHFIDFPIRWKAFLWAPSSLMLTWLTDVSLASVGGRHQPTSPIIYIVAILVVVLVCLRLRQVRDSVELRGSFFEFVVPNLLILLALFLFMASFANLDELDHRLLSRLLPH